MKKKVEKLFRVNHGIRPDQNLAIKDIATKKEMGEGEVLRMMIDYYLNRENK
jgi:hypothetical protein